MNKYRNIFIGFVEIPNMTYNMQEIFNTKGYFAIKATPLEANICLLEDRDVGELEGLVAEGADWLRQWFK